MSKRNAFENWLKAWLTSHGDRDITDLKADREKGLHVYMSNGRYDQIKVYLEVPEKYKENCEELVGNLLKSSGQMAENCGY